jgi:Na+/H+-dicarboxylate symporter/ABC-type amino acid transport substrate-binding protein
MMVLPYVTISIISSLGGLDYAEAKRLGLRAGAVLIGLWIIALLFTFLFPFVFPDIETASFFSTTAFEKTAPFDFVNLFIPSNPFYALANGIVPAVVLFSVIIGIAVIGLERKQVLLDVLAVAGEAVSRATRFVVRLTPYGIFAIATHAAGTLKLEQIEYIQVYLVSYMVIALLVALWVLPGLVSALTPIRYGEILELTRVALVTAFMAGDLFIVLPILIESCKELLERHQLTDQHTRALPDAIVPTSFNFPHTGKLLSLSFILFAGWFSEAALSLGEYPRLAFSGVLTFFGSLNMAVPFLLDLFRIPADTFQLFLATGVVNARFGALVAASHTIAVGLLGSAAVVGALHLKWSRLFRYFSITLVLTLTLVVGMRSFFETILRPEFQGARVVYGMTGVLPHSFYRALTELPSDEDPYTSESVLDSIRTREALRVGVLPNHLPFAFNNQNEELVGFDVEMAQLLSQSLGVPVEFYLVERGQVPDVLAKGTIDLAMSGLVVTPERASAMRLSDSYLDLTLAFVVRDHLRDKFSSWSTIRELRPIRVGIPNVPYFIQEVRARLPHLEIEIIDDPEKILDTLESYDAVVLPAERGSIITLLHPEYSSVVPGPDIVRIPLAYPLARHDGDWAHFINSWIELKQKDGTVDRLYQYWILGRGAIEKRPRWSILRDVFDWQ